MKEGNPMENKLSKELPSLLLTLDNEKMIIRIQTQILGKSYEGDFFLKQTGNYKLYSTNHAYDKQLGQLLFDFVNADFKTIDGFESFVSEWGFSGLCEINEEFNIDANLLLKEYTVDELKEFLFYCYNLISPKLIEAQSDFIKVLDFCINNNKITHLDDLSPLKRYYIGTRLNIIPTLSNYSTECSISFYTKTTNVPYKKYYNLSHTYSVEELCNLVKDDNVIINETYSSRNIITFAYIEFFNLLNHFSISKCANCQQYFIPKTKTNEVYCEACRHIGYINKVKNNKHLSAYNTAYKTKHAQKQRKVYGKSEEFKNKYDNALESWRKEAKLKLKLVEEGKISEETFNEFLKSKLEV